MANATRDNLSIFFTEKQAASLSHLSMSTLRNWQKRGLIDVIGRPDGAAGPFRRFYTFNDVVTLRVLANLRKQHRVSLKTIEGTARVLRELGENPWQRTIYVLNREVLFEHPKSGQIATADNQLALIDLRAVETATRGDVQDLLERPSASIGQVTRQRNILGNAYTVEGTRVRTSSIRAFHDAGYSHDQIRQEYPGITESDINAALAFERSRSSTAA